MTREEFEKILVETGWERRYHGTHSALYQKEHRIIDLSDKGVEVGSSTGMISRRLPWCMVNVQDGKLIIHWEVEL